MPDGWPYGDSPFHKGEQQVQERLGVRDRIESFARRVVRDAMPDQHRQFYAELPFVMLGTVDDRGRPWASLVPGRPGFMTSPDAGALEVAAGPLFGDPLHGTLKPGADVGVLGIQFETRRRNRMVGTISSVEPGRFAITVAQAFGNCPQYIQTRALEMLPEIDEGARKRPVGRADRFDRRTRALIERADTLFIATAYSKHSDTASQGADVSHRGGSPGFVRVEDDRTFVFPDFSGNNHFNTVGNIVVNPKAGFLFVDFEAGDLVYMTGEAEIVWEGEEVDAFAGAERLIRFRAEEVVRVEDSLPLRFDFGEYSPMLEHTGSWAQAAQTIAAENERNVYLPYEICDIQPESEVITSFYLRRADGKTPARHEPGQFLPIRLTIPGQDDPLIRTYTLSDASNANHYRLSIKREGGDALVSNHFHDHLKKGDRLEAMAPRGKFVLDGSSNRPVVLVSAGVGLTPMIAMTNHLINEGLRTRNFRRTYFIHGARNGRALAFGDHVRGLAAEHDSLTVHLRLSRPEETDRLGETYHSEGHVDVELMKSLLPFDDYDFYLCGPQPFMQELYDGLTALGVRDDRIHYESFGPATVLKHDGGPKRASPLGTPVEGPVSVCFADSDVEAKWSPDKGTLLELAEAAGLNPAFSCRSGVCGTCVTRLRCGKVDYIEEPVAPHGDHDVLICCATPRSSAGDATCGEDQGVVLEL
ncbi:MAG: 2Fe-2S iron-sulfur cluster binding domain-containing protein [Alphaproteobacteria bacterium]|nr:2Fe-2S iron-sulfur cluster binding domain-containing protein [Alphaproteobacteria bacterium]